MQHVRGDRTLRCRARRGRDGRSHSQYYPTPDLHLVEMLYLLDSDHTQLKLNPRSHLGVRDPTLTDRRGSHQLDYEQSSRQRGSDNNGEVRGFRSITDRVLALAYTAWRSIPTTPPTSFGRAQGVDE